MPKPISSQAATKAEGSTTIPEGSRAQESSKRPAPLSWGDDIVCSSWKREAALKNWWKTLPEIYGAGRIVADLTEHMVWKISWYSVVCTFGLRPLPHSGYGQCQKRQNPEMGLCGLIIKAPFGAHHQ